MRFAFDDEQLAFRDGLRDLLAKECAPARLREAWTNESGRVPGLWAQLTEMGVVGMLAPPDAGGLGLDEVDLVLLLEETGRQAVPEPIVETAAVAVPLLAAAGDARLPAVVAGADVAAIGPLDEYAVWADSARFLLLFDDGDAHLLEATATTREPRASVDGARRLSWIDADLGDATRVGASGAAGPALDRAALGVAAQQCGLAARMLELTVDYAKERRQFGVPIGSFQAVKHHLANARVALEFARPLVYRSAWSLAHSDPGAGVHVSMAKAHADAAALTTARAALQCHGAIGYTTEYDLHLYMKRTWALARTGGDAAWHRNRVGSAIL